MNTAFSVPARDLEPLLPLEAAVKAIAVRCHQPRCSVAIRHSPIILTRQVSSIASATGVGELPLIDLERRGIWAWDQLAAGLDRVADWIIVAYEERRHTKAIIGEQGINDLSAAPTKHDVSPSAPVALVMPSKASRRVCPSPGPGRIVAGPHCRLVPDPSRSCRDHPRAPVMPLRICLALSQARLPWQR